MVGKLIKYWTIKGKIRENMELWRKKPLFSTKVPVSLERSAEFLMRSFDKEDPGRGLVSGIWVIWGRNSNYKDYGISWLLWVSLMHWRKMERLRVTDHKLKVNYERQRVFFGTERTENKVQDLITRVAEDRRKLRAKLSPWCSAISWGNQWISWCQVDCSGAFSFFPILLGHVILYCLYPSCPSPQ